MRQKRLKMMWQFSVDGKMNTFMLGLVPRFMQDLDEDRNKKSLHYLIR